MDSLIFQYLNHFAGKNEWLDGLGIFFASRFEYFLIGFIFLFLLKNLKKYWLIVIQAFFAAILARFVITDIIHAIFPRLRPFAENQVNLLIPPEATSSFPSGHASFYFALSTVVYFYNKKAGILFFISSFLIAISRVFTGVHWPSDILAGILVGIFSGWLVKEIFKKSCIIKTP